MKNYILPVLLVAAGTTFGQAGAGYAATGNNLSNTFAGLSLANNPGKFPDEKLGFGFWGRNRFTATDLIHGGLATHAAFGKTALGFQIQYSGTPYFYHNIIELAAVQKFSDNFCAGFSAGMAQISQGSGYGNKRNLNGKLGLSAVITPLISAHCVISNPWGLGERIYGSTPRADFSICWEASPQTAISAQSRIEINNGQVFGISLRHKVAENITGLGYLQSGAEPLGGGLVYSTKNCKISISTGYHVYLGFSPSFSIQWIKK